MRKIYFSFMLSLLLADLMFAQATYEIKAQGLTYVPSALTVLAGDTVVFNAGPTHPVLEVSQATWEANGLTALDGGFAFPGGSGEIVFQTPGIYYYICTNHISSGMKGRIEVNAITALPDVTQVNQNFRLFPNPLYGNNLQIKYHADKEYSVTFWLIDLNGRHVKKSAELQIIRGDNNILIDTGNLSPGVYFFEMTGTDLHLYARLIKMQ